MVTTEAYRGFAAILDPSLEEHDCHSDRRETGTQIGETENHIVHTKSENP